MERARIESYEKMCQMNKFSKEYYLYPEQIKQQEQIKLGKLQKELRVIQEKKLTPAFLIEELQARNKKTMSQILAELEFDPGDIDENVKWLELSLFDNTKTEIFRSPQKLFELFRHEEGFLNRIEGEVLLREADSGAYVWRECTVQMYDEETRKWQVRVAGGSGGRVYYDGLGQVSEELKTFRTQCDEFMVERICFVFDFEDKFQFAERFVEANINRVLKNSLIRYSFYVNAMVNHNQPLGIKNKKRILDKLFRMEVAPGSQNFSVDLATWKDQMIGKLKQVYPAKGEAYYLAKVEEVDATIDNFYTRSINKVIFDYYYKKGDTGELIQEAELMLPVDFYFRKPARRRGIVDVYEGRAQEKENLKKAAPPPGKSKRKSEDQKKPGASGQKVNEDDSDRVLRLPKMNFLGVQERLKTNFLFHEDKTFKTLKLLNSLSLELKKFKIFSTDHKGPLSFQMFQSIQEKTIYRFRDFLKYEWYQGVVADLEKKITKKKLVEEDRQEDLLDEFIDEEQTAEVKSPRMKNVFILKPKYAQYLKVINMKMKQELEAVLVLEFGAFLDFLNRNIPNRIKINDIKEVQTFYSTKREIEFVSKGELAKLRRGSEAALRESRESNSLWFRPCLVSLIMNKVALGRKGGLPQKIPEKSPKPPLVPATSTEEDCVEELRTPLFNAEVIVQDSQIKINERPKKFLKYIKLLFEKTFRYFYKLQLIEFNLEETSEKSLITRELVRGLRSHEPGLTGGREYLFGWKIEGSRRISARKGDCPKDYQNWFQKNLGVIMEKLEANVKKVKQYQAMLGNLQKFIHFDFRAYLKQLGLKEDETVSSLLEKIDEKKDEIELIESLYPEEIDIGGFTTRGSNLKGRFGST